MKVRLRGRVAGCVPALFRLAYRATLCGAVSLLAWPAFVTAESAYAQWSGERQLRLAPSGAQEEILTRKSPLPEHKISVRRGTPLGRLSIPRLNLSYVVLEGTDNRTLDKSIGHIEDTAPPGGAGNVGIAGHRNTHFRKLEWIRKGDEIVLTTPHGEYRYRVEWMRLFRPAEIDVLDPGHGPAVTLVTCFPFEYVGAAPLRMIVRALPDEQTRAALGRQSSPKS